MDDETPRQFGLFDFARLTAATFAAAPAFTDPRSIGTVRIVAATAGIVAVPLLFVAAFRIEWLLARRFLYDASGRLIPRSGAVALAEAGFTLLAYGLLAFASWTLGQAIVDTVIPLFLTRP